jgi:hypothetical protein
MADNQTIRSGGVGLPTLLFVVFLVLKLTNNIDWSWVWVCSPLWISAVIAIPFILVGLAVMALAASRMK